MKDKLACPTCGHLTDGKVVDSRLTGNSIRRRRACDKCKRRFTTYEVVVEDAAEAKQIVGSSKDKLRKLISTLRNAAGELENTLFEKTYGNQSSGRGQADHQQQD